MLAYCMNMRVAWVTLIFFAVLTGGALANAETQTVASSAAGAGVDGTTSIDPRMQLPVWFRSVVLAIRAGRYEEARAATRAGTGDPAQGRLWLRYVDGLILKHKRQYSEAATAFRDILADYPASEAIRAELAHTLFLAKDDGAAQRHYDLLLTASGDEKTAALYRHRLANIRQRRKLRFSGYFAVAPSSNINNGSTAETIEFFGLPFEIDKASRKKGGVGLAGGLHGIYRHEMRGPWAGQFAVGVDTIRYKTSQFNSLVISASAMPEWSFSRGHVGLGVVGSRQFRGDSPSHLRLGLKGEVFARASQSLQISASTTFQDVTYDRWDWLDGTHLMTSAKVTKGLSRTKTIHFFSGFDQVTTQTLHNDYTHPWGGLGYYHEWPFGLLTYLEGRYGEYQYDGQAPGTNVSRHDREVRAGIKILKRDFSWKGFAPRVGLSWQQRRSNVALYESDQAGFELHLTREF